MKICILDAYTTNPGDLSWEGLEALAEVTAYDETGTKELVLERAADAEIVLTNKTPLDRDIIFALPKLKFIGVLATGFNVVDIKAAKEKGVPVSNIPTYGTKSVAQMTFALLLEICHHVQLHSDTVHDGKWSNGTHFCYWETPLMELDGKTMGLIGFGRIGRAVAEIAKAFGLNILVYDNYTTNFPDYCRQVTLDELLEKSDVVSLHCPQTEETAGIINAANLKKMKKSAILINTARGGLVCEDDLAAALNQGDIYAAALDVLSCDCLLYTSTA